MQTRALSVRQYPSRKIVDYGVQSPPVNTVKPYVTGDVMEGQTVHGFPGTWSGTTPITYTPVWYFNGGPIDGANDWELLIEEGWAGGTLLFQVVAENIAGTASEYIEAGLPITDDALANTVLPSISGYAIPGSTLTGDYGTWSGLPPITFEPGWTRDGVVIAGATDITFIIPEDDDDYWLGSEIRFAPTVFNPDNLGGYTAVTSDPVTVTALVVPEIDTPPVISGNNKPGQTLTVVSDAVWLNPVVSTVRQWCADGVPITDENSATYITVEDDVGKAITMEETATNGAGDSAPAASNDIVIEANAELVAVLDFSLSIAGGLTDEQARLWTAEGDAAITDDVYPEGALSLNGSTGTIYFTDENVNSDFSLGSDFYVGATIRATGNGDNYCCVIGSAVNGSFTGGWRLEASTGRGLVFAGVGGAHAINPAGIDPSDGNEHRLEVIAVAGEIEMKWDGDVVATLSYGGGYPTSSGVLYIGGSPDAHFEGYIKDVQIKKPAIPAGLGLLDVTFTGADGTTTAVDVQDHTLTFNNGAAISTANDAGGALALSGGAYVEVVGSENEYTFPGDFSIKFDSLKTTGSASDYDVAMTTDFSGGGTDGWILELSATRGLFFFPGPGGGPSLSYGDTGYATDSTRHSYEVRRIAGTLELLIDEVSVATTFNEAVFTGGLSLKIGSTADGTYYFEGEIYFANITQG